jgi:hypothetical protein
MIGSARVFEDGSCMTPKEWLDIYIREKTFHYVMQDAFGIDRRGAPDKGARANKMAAARLSPRMASVGEGRRVYSGILWHEVVFDEGQIQ